jgi:hypothetical protein
LTVDFAHCRCQVRQHALPLAHAACCAAAVFQPIAFAKAAAAASACEARRNCACARRRRLAHTPRRDQQKQKHFLFVGFFSRSPVGKPQHDDCWIEEKDDEASFFVFLFFYVHDLYVAQLFPTRSCVVCKKQQNA